MADGENVDTVTMSVAPSRQPGALSEGERITINEQGDNKDKRVAEEVTPEKTFMSEEPLERGHGPESTREKIVGCSELRREKDPSRHRRGSSCLPRRREVQHRLQTTG